MEQPPISPTGLEGKNFSPWLVLIHFQTKIPFYCLLSTLNPVLFVFRWVSLSLLHNFGSAKLLVKKNKKEILVILMVPGALILQSLAIKDSTYHLLK